MSISDVTSIPAPPCPVCGEATRLKELFKSDRPGGDTSFFKCTACGVEYPVYAPDLARASPSPGTP